MTSLLQRLQAASVVQNLLLALQLSGSLPTALLVVAASFLRAGSAIAVKGY